MARGLAVEFCITHALMIISGRGKSNCARIRFRSRICASSPGFVSENTSRSDGFCSPVPAATAIDAMAIGLGVAAVELAPDPEPPPAGAPPDAADATEPADAEPLAPEAQAQAEVLVNVNPAMTQGVVSDLSSITLPGG